MMNISGIWKRFNFSFSIRIGMALVLLIGLLAAMPAAPAWAADVNLRGYWALDGNANDSSGYGNNGTLTGGNWSTSHAPTGFANTGSLELNGSSGQGIQSPLVTTASNNVSMSVWVNWSGPNGNGQAVLYNGNTGTSGYGIYILPSGSLDILNGGVSFASSNFTLTPGVWQYVVIMRDAGVWKLYVDGSLIPLAGNPAPNTPYGQTDIGRSPVSSVETFNGLIDDARIYDRVLTSAEYCSTGITVTNANDSGPGSLRSAITGLCAGGTITFNNDYTILLASELAIGKNMTIDGAGHVVTVSGNHVTRVFNLTGGTVTLNQLTIADGYFVDSSYVGISGGGIYVNGSTLYLTNSTVSGNTTGWPGGGGIELDAGTANVISSTFIGNTGSYGGGIDSFRDTTLNVVNSTFSGNSAGNAGGGLSVGGVGNIINSTISGNSSGWSNGGGGINNEGGAVTIMNSIITNNPAGNNCFNHYPNYQFTGLNSLANDNSCDTGFTNSTTIRLGSLSNNGGSTQTFPLLSGSSAINAGDDAVCAADPVSGMDQRSMARPQGAHCDIGAFEAKLLTVTANDKSMTFGGSEPSYDYTQSPVDATFITAPTCTAGTVTNAGTYPISCSGGVPTDPNDTVAYVDGTLTVNKANSSVTVTVTTTFTYNGSAQGPDNASVTGSTGAVTFSYAGTGATTYGPSSTKPSNAGDYTVTATVAEDTNYNSASSTPINFTINKAGSSVTVSCPAAPQPYSGSAQTPCTASYTTADGLSGSLTPTYSNNTNVGTATASANYAGDTNHEAASNSATFTIGKGPSSVTVTGTTTFTYNGLPQGPDTATVTGSTGAVTFSYAGTGTTTYGPSSTKPSNAGTYTVTAAVAEDDNYTSASSSPTAFAIGSSAPTATTQAATAVKAMGATLNGTVNANSSSTTVIFEYGLTAGYGSTITAIQSPVEGTVDTTVSATLTSLTSNTTYHFRVVAVNAGGTTNGTDMTFTTAIAAPDATTGAANTVTATGATLTGTVNANSASTTVTFEYGETTSYGSTIIVPQSPVSGTIDTAVSAVITGLKADTTYHFRVVADNPGGTTRGLDQTFTTEKHHIYLPFVMLPIINE